MSSGRDTELHLISDVPEDLSIFRHHIVCRGLATCERRGAPADPARLAPHAMLQAPSAFPPHRCTALHCAPLARVRVHPLPTPPSPATARPPSPHRLCPAPPTLPTPLHTRHSPLYPDSLPTLNLHRNIHHSPRTLPTHTLPLAQHQILPHLDPSNPNPLHRDPPYPSLPTDTHPTPLPRLSH